MNIVLSRFVLSTVSDLRLGLRMLRLQPGTSLLAVVALALGIGLTTTVFSIVNGIVFRGLPVEQGHRIYSLSRVSLLGRDANEGDASPSRHDYADWRARQRSFDDLAAFHVGTANVVARDGAPERYRAAWVTVNTFTLLRTRPVIGRDFAESDGRSGAQPVVIIGEKVWRERFGGDPAVVGRPLRVNGTPMTVVGVMPPGFGFPTTQDLWVALTDDIDGGARAQSTRVRVIGRLGTNSEVAPAVAEMATIARQLEQQFPETNRGIGIAVKPYVEEFLGTETIGALIAMLVAVLGVLAIACANVANLVLARVADRGKELAVRTAMGAARWRVGRQVLAEVSILAALGASGGLALAFAGVAAFSRAIVDTNPPFFINIVVDGTVLLFVMGVTVLATLLSGLVPAIRASGTDLQAALNDEGRGTTSLRMGRFSKGLVVGEMALSFGLLVASALVIQSIVNIARADFGFATADIWTGRVAMPDEDYSDDERRRLFAETLVERVRLLPGVLGAAVTTSVPPVAPQVSVRLPGHVDEPGRGFPQTRQIAISPDFFAVMRVRVLRGRPFTAADHDRAPRVAVVNASFAQSYYPEGAIGRQVAFAGGASTEWRTIVGVVNDTGMAEVDEGEVPEGMYLPIAQMPSSNVALVVHTAGPPLLLTSAVRDVVRSLDPTLPVFNVMTVAQHVEQQTWGITVFGSLFMAFGVAALFLATVGLYGVMAFSVSRRTQEIGVRMALGATGRDVLRQVLGQGMWQVSVGMLLGAGLAALLSGAMRLLLFGVDSYEPMTFVAVASLLALTGGLSCLVPALRAASVEPIQALRRR